MYIEAVIVVVGLTVAVLDFFGLSTRFNAFVVRKLRYPFEELVEALELPFTGHHTDYYPEKFNDLSGVNTVLAGLYYCLFMVFGFVFVPDIPAWPTGEQWLGLIVIGPVFAWFSSGILLIALFLYSRFGYVVYFRDHMRSEQVVIVVVGLLIYPFVIAGAVYVLLWTLFIGLILAVAQVLASLKSGFVASVGLLAALASVLVYALAL